VRRCACHDHSRDEEFSAFVEARRTGLVRSAYLLTAGDTHFAEDLVQTALARLYLAWPKVRRAGTETAGMHAAVVLRHWLGFSVAETPLPSLDG